MSRGILEATYESVTPLSTFLGLEEASANGSAYGKDWNAYLVCKRPGCVVARPPPVAAHSQSAGPTSQREAVSAAVARLVAAAPDSLLARGYRRRVSNYSIGTAFAADIENVTVNSNVDRLCQRPWRELFKVIGGCHAEGPGAPAAETVQLHQPLRPCDEVHWSSSTWHFSCCSSLLNVFCCLSTESLTCCTVLTLTAGGQSMVTLLTDTSLCIFEPLASGCALQLCGVPINLDIDRLRSLITAGGSTSMSPPLVAAAAIAPAADSAAAAVVPAMPQQHFGGKRGRVRSGNRHRGQQPNPPAAPCDAGHRNVVDAVAIDQPSATAAAVAESTLAADFGLLHELRHDAMAVDSHAAAAVPSPLEQVVSELASGARTVAPIPPAPPAASGSAAKSQPGSGTRGTWLLPRAHMFYATTFSKHAGLPSSHELRVLVSDCGHKQKSESGPAAAASTRGAAASSSTMTANAACSGTAAAGGDAAPIAGQSAAPALIATLQSSTSHASPPSSISTVAEPPAEQRPISVSKNAVSFPISKNAARRLIHHICVQQRHVKVLEARQSSATRSTGPASGSARPQFSGTGAGNVAGAFSGKGSMQHQSSIGGSGSPGSMQRAQSVQVRSGHAVPVRRAASVQPQRQAGAHSGWTGTAAGHVGSPPITSHPVLSGPVPDIPHGLVRAIPVFQELLQRFAGMQTGKLLHNHCPMKEVQPDASQVDAESGVATSDSMPVAVLNGGIKRGRDIGDEPGEAEAAMFDRGQAAAAAAAPQTSSTAPPKMLQLATPQEHVMAFVRAYLQALIPSPLWGGSHNQRHVLRVVWRWINMGHRDVMRVCDVLDGLRTTDFDCFASAPPARTSSNGGPASDAIVATGGTASSDSTKTRHPSNVLDSDVQAKYAHAWVLYLLINVVTPLLWSCFYITDSEASHNRMLYYRKPVWARAAAATMDELKQRMSLRPIPMQAAIQLLSTSDRQGMGWAAVRLTPKTSGMRPIMNLAANVGRIGLPKWSDGKGGNISGSGKGPKRPRIDSSAGAGSSAAASAVAGATTPSEFQFPVAVTRHTTSGSLKLSDRSINSMLAPVHEVLKFERLRTVGAAGSAVFGMDGMHIALRAFAALRAPQLEMGQPSQPKQSAAEALAADAHPASPSQPHGISTLSSYISVISDATTIRASVPTFASMSAVSGSSGVSHPGNRRKLHIFTADVKSAYDTINQQKLLDVVVPMLKEDCYSIRTYASVSAPPKVDLALSAFATERTEAAGTTLASGADSGVAASSSRSLTVSELWTRRRKSAFPSSEVPAFGSWVENMATSRKISGQVLCDLVQETRVQRKDAVALLTHHIKAHMVFLRSGGGMHIQGAGIPQGSILSALLCNLYFGHWETHKIMPTVTSRLASASGLFEANGHQLSPTTGPTLLMRLTDDFCVASENEPVAKTFAEVIHEGAPEYGARINIDKTESSFPFTVRPADGSSPVEIQALVPSQPAQCAIAAGSPASSAPASLTFGDLTLPPFTAPAHSPAGVSLGSSRRISAVGGMNVIDHTAILPSQPTDALIASGDGSLQVTSASGNHQGTGADAMASGDIRIGWCGLKLNAHTGEVFADNSRYFGNGGILDAVTVSFAPSPAVALSRMLRSFLRPKCHAILLDGHINSLQTVSTNVYEICVIAAAKLLAVLRQLNGGTRASAEEGPAAAAAAASTGARCRRRGVRAAVLLRLIQGGAEYLSVLVRSRCPGKSRQTTLMHLGAAGAAQPTDGAGSAAGGAAAAPSSTLGTASSNTDLLVVGPAFITQLQLQPHSAESHPAASYAADRKDLEYAAPVSSSTASSPLTAGGGASGALARPTAWCALSRTEIQWLALTAFAHVLTKCGASTFPCTEVTGMLMQRRSQLLSPPIVSASTSGPGAAEAGSNGSSSAAFQLPQVKRPYVRVPVRLAVERARRTDGSDLLSQIKLSMAKR